MWPEQTYIYLSDQTPLWKFGTVDIKLALAISSAPVTAINMMAWTCFGQAGAQLDRSQSLFYSVPQESWLDYLGATWV